MKKRTKPHTRRYDGRMTLFLLVACRAAPTAIDTGDSGSADTGPIPIEGAIFDDSGRVSSAWRTVLFPADMVKWLGSRVTDDALLCPARADLGGGHWTLTGDCADGSGTVFQGSVDFSGVNHEWPWFTAPFDAAWTNFGWYLDDVGGLVMNGPQTGTGGDGLDALESPFTITGTVMGNEYNIVYARHSLSGFAGLVSGSAPWTVSGAATMDLGASIFDFSLEGGGTYADGCPSEPGTGAITLAAADDSVTFQFDGSANCDGCIPYTTGSGVTGQVCAG